MAMVNAKLHVSKTKIFDATVYCALRGHGVKMIETDSSVEFLFTDFELYISVTEDLIMGFHSNEKKHRYKALQKWFDIMPPYDLFILGDVKLTIKSSKLTQAKNIIKRIRNTYKYD